MPEMVPDPARLARRLWAAVLVSNSLWIGFVAGAAGGARLFIDDDGLVGAATVLWWGLGGALIAALAAATAIRALEARRVRTLAVVALVVAAALATVIAQRAAG
jgi:hypothetical protein